MPLWEIPVKVGEFDEDWRVAAQWIFTWRKIVKFYPIRNDEALGFFKNHKNKNNMSMANVFVRECLLSI